MPRLRYNLAEIPDFVDIEPGRYPARLGAVVKGDSRAGNPMLTWTWTLLKGPNKGSKVKSYTSLQEQALSNLKQHLMAFGLKGKIDSSTDDLIGEKALVVLAKQAGESRDGSPQMFTRIVAVLPIRKAAEEDEDESEDEEEEPRPKKKKAVVEDDEDEDEEPAPKKKKKVATDEDEDEDEEPAPRKKLKKVASKSDDDDEDDEPF